MYRRRRLVALVVVVGVVIAVVMAARALAAAVTLPPAPASSQVAPVVSGPAPLPGGEVYVVQPGDTLWSIAGRVAPGVDRRDVVDRLAAQRGDGPLRPGERILLP